MIRHPLQHDQGIVIVITGYSGPGQQTHVVSLSQLRRDPGHPVHARPAIYALTIAQQGTAEFGPFIGQDNTGPGTPGPPGRRQTRRPSPHHQNIAMGILLVVMVGVGSLRCPAQTRHAPDHGFIGGPQAGRPHEGLVIEPGRK